MQTLKTPGTPHVGLRRPKEDDPIVDPEEHREYRSGVGMLMYLVKHSRPDIANAARELSKLMDKPMPATMKELYRVIKYVLDTESFGLKMDPIKMDNDKGFTIVLFSDSD